MLRGGVGGNQFPTFDAESKIALKKFFSCKKFSKFSGKKCLGMVLDFEYQVVRVYFVYANHKMLQFEARLKQFANNKCFRKYCDRKYCETRNP